MEISTSRVTRAGKVDKSEVHKLHEDRVWLQTAEELDATSLRAHFRVPTIEPGPRFAELVEVQRQAGMVQCHRQLRGLGTAVFVLTSIALSVERVKAVATHTVAGTVCSRLVMPHDGGGRPRETTQHFDVLSPDLTATGTARVQFVPRAVYHRLPGATPSGRWRVGTSDRFGEELPLMSPDSDPLLTDHPSDHVTAMEIVCAVERAVNDCFNRNLMSLAISFKSYAQHENGPLRLLYSLAPGGRFDGVVAQADMPKATVRGRLDGRNLC